MKMEQKTVNMVGNTIELSETKTYVELTNRVCYYDAPNLNNVVLPASEALEKAQTLVGQPLVAKYKKINNEDDLGGHECSFDKKGNVIFGTDNVGVHTSVEIKDDKITIGGETKTLPCLFAKCRVWTRNKNVVSAIKRLFSEGKLHSSWEILTSSYEYRDGLKYLLDYVFETDALLGSKSSPAYGSCATTLALAEEDPDMIIAEALTNDIYTSNKEENMPKNEKNISDSAVKENKEDINTARCNTDKEKDKSDTATLKDNNNEKSFEIAELTDRDIRDLLNKQIENGWVSLLFPADNYALVQKYGQTELEFTKYNYTVVNDTVVVGDKEEVKLTVSVSEINNVVSEKNNAILEAEEKNKALQAEIERLTPYKEMAEKAQAEKEAKELAEKQDKLKKYALKSNYITSEEIDTDENIQKMISEIDENGIKNLIVDRLMTAKEQTTVSKKSTTEEIATASLISDDKDTADYKSIIKNFLNK